MKSITDRLIQTAALSRRFLEEGPRDRIGGFIMEHQGPDGGFRGRGGESSLRSTLLAVAGLKALGDPIPVFRLRKYIRSFRSGDGLERLELVCLIRLREAFRMSGFTRRRLLSRLEQQGDESAGGIFLRRLAEERGEAAGLPGEPVRAAPDDPTAALAASLLLSRRADDATIEALRGRAAESGGFIPSAQEEVPDLFSTAAALFSLTSAGAGHADDETGDVESTFYALLSIGALIKSMAKEHETDA